ncbi:hypothetical protein ON010_g17949 [Phytophthora cinnamomi]|nr:hypothetical protein ON010_g17949 [Phytophthora cinnamomi]
MRAVILGVLTGIYGTRQRSCRDLRVKAGRNNTLKIAVLRIIDRLDIALCITGGTSFAGINQGAIGASAPSYQRTLATVLGVMVNVIYAAKALTQQEVDGTEHNAQEDAEILEAFLICRRPGSFFCWGVGETEGELPGGVARLADFKYHVDMARSNEFEKGEHRWQYPTCFGGVQVVYDGASRMYSPMLLSWAAQTNRFENVDPDSVNNDPYPQFLGRGGTFVVRMKLADFVTVKQLADYYSSPNISVLADWERNKPAQALRMIEADPTYRNGLKCRIYSVRPTSASETRYEARYPASAPQPAAGKCEQESAWKGNVASNRVVRGGTRTAQERLKQPRNG